jgi:hypothetical protein
VERDKIELVGIPGFHVADRSDGRFGIEDAYLAVVERST